MASVPDTEPQPQEGKKAGLAAMLPTALALVAGLAAGGAGGAFVVGPALAAGITPAAMHAAKKSHADAEAAGEDEAHAEGEDDEAAAEDEEGGEEKGEKKEGETAAKPVYTIDNLVLNPAQSGGTRFLLFTIAFEAKDQAIVDELKARDAELRDVVLNTLGAKPVEVLSEMTMRDSLKAELQVATSKLFKKKKAIRRVYFPQFVIQ